MTLEGVIKYPLVFSFAFAVTYALTPLVARLAAAVGAVDEPGERRLNTRPVPRMGGLAVFLGFHAACAIVFLLPWMPFGGRLDVLWWHDFLIGSALILFLGTVDDIRSLRPHLKLVGQIAVALLMFVYDMRVGKILGLTLPETVDLAVTVFWYLALINAFNLIDGLDGLAAGLACVGAIGVFGAMLFLRQPGDALILLGLCGAGLAFLRFNFYPAKIFLGDSGSMFLGFAFASIGLATSSKGTTVAALGICLLAAGIPIFDTMLAVWRRSLRLFNRNGNGAVNGVMSADMEHLHHRLLRSGVNQRRVAVWLYMASGLLVTFGLLAMAYNSQAVGIFLIAFVLGTYVVVRHVAHVELWDSGSAILEGLKRPSSMVLVVLLYPLVDFLLLTLSLAFTLMLLSPELAPKQLKDEWIYAIPIWCGVPFISLFLIQTYNRVWSRARMTEFLTLDAALLAGVTLSWGAAIVAGQGSSDVLFPFAVIHFLMSSLFLVGCRVLPRSIPELMSVLAHQTGERGNGNDRILLYGAGDRCALYLKRATQQDPSEQRSNHIVGILDDDRNLRKRVVYGYRVLGELGDLEDLIQSEDLNHVVVACSLPQHRLAELLGICRLHRVVVTEWNPQTHIIYDGQELASEAIEDRLAV